MAMSGQPKPYKRTLFDRLGPVALDIIRSASYGVMVFGLTLAAVQFAAGKMSLAVVLWAALAGIGTSTVSFLLARAAGGAAKAFTHGASTPYEDQYSYQQALMMQGKFAEALASFDAAIAVSPSAATPRIKAAELCVQHLSDPRRAAEYLRAAQRLTTLTPGEDLYVTNRLVDLYAGPLGDPGRACVELRRLIDRYPASANAARAREALARMKERLSESS